MISFGLKGIVLDGGEGTFVLGRNASGIGGAL